MGGSGGGSGGGFSYSSPTEYKNEIDDIREKSYDESFETNVNQLISEKLGLANSRDVETIKEYLDEIVDIISEDIDGTLDLNYGGSVSKYTYVEGLSDVDVLLKINKSELSDKTPKEVLEYIKSRLDTNLQNVDEIKVGNLAVTVKFKDGNEIQILPSIKSGDGYKIPSSNGERWSNIIRPDNFASRLTKINQQCGGKVIPVIKIVKHINSKLPTDQQLSGYHIESLAIEIFKSYPDELSNTHKTMVKHFFEKSSEKVKSPIKDKTNQSIHVDDYLGKENSPQRLRMGYILSRKYKLMKAADESKSLDMWENILGDDG